MKNMPKYLPLTLIIIGLAFLAIACGGGAGEPVEVTVPVEITRLVQETVEVPVEVEVVVTPEPMEVIEIPFEDLWVSSGHADAMAEAFRHWDEDDPAAVPASCARCHTPTGYQDYIGADGTAANMVDAETHPVSNGITCVACHNDVTVTMTSVVMPSGIELTGLGDESRCMQCHQGRSSKFTVDEAVAEAGDDDVLEEQGFINIHYYAAAATKYGTVAKGGYEYDGKVYDAFFVHVDGYTTCIGCHNPHTLQLKVDECQACHTGVETAEDFKDVRMSGSLVDFDGDGDLREGVYWEIDGLREILYGAMQAYAAGVVGTPVVYDSQAYPYFFIDDGNGEVDEGEANFGNRYITWTPRLLKAAYNYQVASKDPGAFAHGGKYIIQLLYDSIESLDAGLVANLRRIDHGHFAGSEEAFRHWDEDGAVPGRCSRCHSAQGLPLYINEGVSIEQPLANGFQCANCHNDLQEFTRYEVTSVTFPSGAVIDSDLSGPNALLCMNCHQGRESTVSVNAALAGLPDDTVDEGIRFRNIHYFAAGATRYGTLVKGAYEYDGQTYNGYFEHVPAAEECTECHSAHQLVVQVDVCADCHDGVQTVADLHSIRDPDRSPADYDGDGDIEEGIYGEIDTLRAALLAELQAYALSVGAAPIIYDSHAYPYFFIDSDGDGVTSPGEASFDTRYNAFTPTSLRAAYNYQYAQKDPGAFAHNGHYLIQILIDSIADLGGDVSSYTRPSVSP